MRLASFNVENLFERAKILNRSNWVTTGGTPFSDGRPTLDNYAKLNALLAKPVYTAADKTEILATMRALGIEDSDEGAFVILRRNRGQLVKRPTTGPVTVVANGRDDWIGWLELKTEAVNETATQNTARVFRDISADVVVCVEAEHRISLCRFNEQVVPKVGGAPYDHVMLIDGNDERGIDVGLFARKAAAEIVSVRSHVDDEEGGKTIFSRDCPEFHLKLASGKSMVVLANHLKSKGYGSAGASNAKRLLQATRVRAIYDALRASGVKNIAIAGDFNDTPGSAQLAPLFAQGSDLKDVSTWPGFQWNGRKGSYGNATAGDHIDFILLSPDLFSKITDAGMFRKGVWGGVNGTLWPHFPEVTNANQAGSDHAAVWVDLNI